MMIDVIATHYSAELVHGGKRVAVPGTIGAEKTKSILHRARDRLFNEALAKAWVSKIQGSDHRYRIILNLPPYLVEQTNTP